MRFLRQSLIGLFLVAVAAGLLVYAAQMVGSAIQARLADAPQAPADRERIFAVNLDTVRLGTEVPVLTTYGQIRSRRELELRAAQGGRVIEKAPGVVDGGTVQQGELLIRIDPADAQSALDRARADVMDAEAEARDADRALALARDELAAAEAQADLRERALRRQTDLETRGVGTAAAVETAELAASAAGQAVLSSRQALAQAEARVDQAATRLARTGIALAETERALAETEIRADFSGTLADVSVVEGGLVSPNEQLARLIDPDALEVAFRVSTTQYLRLLDPQGDLIPAPVEVRLDAGEAELTARGRISREGAATESGQTGRLLFADLDGARGFKPGDFVTVLLQEPPVERVARLPASAYDAASGTVLALGADDRLDVVPVELVRRQGDAVLVRADGLEGREVVRARTPLLGAGVQVRALREAAELHPAAAEASADEMVELSPERRARLVAFVQANTGLPAEDRARILAQLQADRVPARMIRRLEARIGG